MPADTIFSITVKTSKGYEIQSNIVGEKKADSVAKANQKKGKVTKEIQKIVD